MIAARSELTGSDDRETSAQQDFNSMHAGEFDGNRKRILNGVVPF